MSLTSELGEGKVVQNTGLMPTLIQAQLEAVIEATLHHALGHKVGISYHAMFIHLTNGIIDNLEQIRSMFLH